MSRHPSWLLGLALLASACSDGGRASAPAASNDGPKAVGVPSAGDKDAGVVGPGVDAGDAGDAGAPPVPVPPVCDPSKTWGAGTLVNASTPDEDRFGAISADELTIAWTTIDAVDASRVVIHYADRSTTSAPFGAAKIFTQPTGYAASDRVALSSDGRALTVVRSDRLGFGVATRATRTDDFGNVSETPYARVNPSALDDPPSGVVVGDPVVGGADRLFFFTVVEPAATHVIRAAARDPVQDPAWGPFDYVLETALEATADGVRRPTGLSSDGRTLFFWDETISIERAAWRDAVSAPFSSFRDLGARRDAAPNASCSHLYYSEGGDLFFANAM